MTKSNIKVGLKANKMMSRTAKAKAGYLLIALALAHPAKGGVLEEIVVTAQKREQSLQDVGIAVTAFSGDQLEALGLENSTDIVNMVPGVYLGGSFAGQTMSFTIRGVAQNDFTDHTETPIAVYIDEAYIPMQQGQNFALLDLERVEVLKGPQGTLFGRNATGGLVSYISRKPTEEFEGFLGLTVGSYDQVRLEGAVSGALTDSLAGRFSALYNYSDSILDNQFPGGDDEWNDNTSMFRAQLSHDSGGSLTANLSIYGGETRTSTSPFQTRQTIAEVDALGRPINSFVVDSNEVREGIGPGGVNADVGNDLTGVPDGVISVRPTPGGDFFGNIDPDGSGLKVDKSLTDKDRNTFSMYGSTLKLDWQRDGFDVVSITDLKVTKRDGALDSDAGPTKWLDFVTDATTESFTQELRILDETDNTRWLAGLYYIYVDSEIDETGFEIPLDSDAPSIVAAGFGGIRLIDQVSLKTNSLSVFGQFEYDFSESVTLTAGARIVQEKKDYKYQSDVLFQDILLANARAFEDDTSDTLWAGKLGLDWRPSDDVLLYATVNRGVKTGSFNAPLAGSVLIADEVIPYTEEVLWAYEAGFKSTLFNNLVRFNGTAYYYDYRDSQAFKFIGLAQQVFNADSTVTGFELDVTMTPTDHLDLMLGLSYNDSNIEDVDLFGNLVDRTAAFSPEWQFNGLARYEWVAFNGTMAAQVDFYYNSGFYYFVTNFDSTEEDGYAMGNVRASWLSGSEAWELAAYVDNFSDTRHLTVGFDGSTGCGCSLTAYNKPRTWGLSVKRRF